MSQVEIISGSLLEDGWNWATDRLDDLWDKVDDLPGFKQLGNVTKDFVQGPLRDFAKANPVGPTVLRAFTSMLMQGAGALAGPWAMMMTATLPGLAKGQNIEQAFISENAYRVTEAVKILTAGQLNVEAMKLIPGLDEFLPKQFNAVVSEVRKKAQEYGLPLDQYLDQLKERAGGDAAAAARNLADQLGVRQDMAVQAFQVMRNERLADPSMSNYDLGSGRWLDPLADLAFQSRPPVVVVKAPLVTSTTVRNEGLSRLQSALGRQPVVKAPVSSSATSSQNASLQATLAALQASQAASRAPAPPGPQLDRMGPGTEEMSVVDAKNFWDSHRTAILVGGGVVLGAIVLYVWSKR